MPGPEKEKQPQKPQKNLMMQETHAILVEDIENLSAKIAEILQGRREALGLGPREDEAAVVDGDPQFAVYQKQLAERRQILQNIGVIEPNPDISKPKTGHWIRVEIDGEQEDFLIVAPADFEYNEEFKKRGINIVTNDSDFFEAIENLGVGQEVEYNSPGGKRKVEIVAISTTPFSPVPSEN